jgi:hypothetical protein
MHEPTYRQALSHSWKLAWHHKSLWILGFFAAFLGQMGITEFLGKISFPTASAFFDDLSFYDFFAKLFSGFSLSLMGWVSLGWIFLLIGCVFLFLFVAAILSQGALIHASALWVKKDHLPNAEKSWHASAVHFWGLLILNILRKIIVVALAALISYSVFQSVVHAETACRLLCLLAVFIGSALIGMVISFLTIYTASYIVVENYPLGWAVSAAWRMFCKHWLVSFEVGFILLGLNLLLGVLALLVLMILTIPTTLAWFVTMLAGKSIIWFILSVVSPFVFALFVVVLGSVFVVFSTSVWTYLFMKMHREGLFSRIVHILRS